MAALHLLQKCRDCLLDLAYPRSCVHCGDGIEGDDYEYLCLRCVRRITRVSPPQCRTCGHPFFGMTEEDRTCPHCLDFKPVYREGRTAVLLKGPARTLVHELKYRQALYLLNDIRRLFERTPGIPEFLAGATLVPVPLHPRKERERGYNQSLKLAEELSRCASGVSVEALLRRVKDTPTQTRLARKARQGNLKNAFVMEEKAVFSPRQRYILVDDVFTTGSTLNECARVMRRRRIRRIDMITFGHG